MYKMYVKKTAGYWGYICKKKRWKWTTNSVFDLKLDCNFSEGSSPHIHNFFFVVMFCI